MYFCIRIHLTCARDVSQGRRSERSGSIYIHNGSKRILCITSHLPCGVCSAIEHINDYERHLLELDQLIPQKCTFPTFIGVDANAVIGCQGFQGEDADVVGRDVCGERDEKGSRFVNWARERGLVVSSTFRLDERTASPVTRYLTRLMLNTLYPVKLIMYFQTRSHIVSAMSILVSILNPVTTWDLIISWSIPHLPSQTRSPFRTTSFSIPNGQCRRKRSRTSTGSRRTSMTFKFRSGTGSNCWNQTKTVNATSPPTSLPRTS